MTLEIQASDRFVEASEDWADQRLMDFEDAFETKAEQALLEVEHLVSGATEVDFEVDGETIYYDPSADVQAFLESRAEEVDIPTEQVLKLYVDLFARVFLDEGQDRPANAPPLE